jgi:RNA polymerase sigma factor (sigma-70 family)
VNLFLSHLRRKKVERAFLSRERGEAARARMEPVDVGQRDELWRALQRLPERQRAAVVLRYFEDLPEAQVAARLGVRPGTAKALLHQARRRLQIELTKENE